MNDCLPLLPLDANLPDLVEVPLIPEEPVQVVPASLNVPKVEALELAPDALKVLKPEHV